MIAIFLLKIKHVFIQKDFTGDLMFNGWIFFFYPPLFLGLLFVDSTGSTDSCHYR